MADAINHGFFDGVGTSGRFTTSLPPQKILSNRKDKKWKQATLDRLELIAEAQYKKNLHLLDYYDMINGDLVYSDYGLPDLTKEIVRLREEIQMPVHARHYDFLGIIVNQVSGEYVQVKDKSIVDNVDPLSQNEFERDRAQKFAEYVQQSFSLEVKRKLAEKGIILDQNKEFESEEEKQQYLQQIQEEENKIIPLEYQQKQINKTWKTQAAEWAEKTLEIDQDRFEMDELNRQEIVDYFLTGRWFRHYHVGYDSYKPERWHPVQVFFSEDLEAKYPQDGEYVGRIHFLSPSDIVNRYGSKIDEETQRRLSGYFDEQIGNQVSQGRSLQNIVRNQGGQETIIPFEGYYDYDLTLQMQELFDTPFGMTTIVENGEKKRIPAWFSPLNNSNGFVNNHHVKALRTDIDLRNDLLQVTECYWRSWQRVGMLTYVTPEGVLETEYVTDDLEAEFLRENEIKTLRKITLEEAEINPQPNTIVYNWIPEIRWGVKVRAHNSYLKEDLYIGGDALPYQIKADSNSYDVQLPVGGYIGNSLAKKLRPFIIQHNIVLNQIYSLLEKELGTFFLFDVNYLPSEYKTGDTRQALEEMYTMIQELGIAPVDTSKQNLQGGNVAAMNAFMTQSLDFTNQIVNRMNLANQFKIQALEQIGITPQRLGQASEYSTAEGIKQGMTASYAQTEPIFAVMGTSSKRANLLHLCVAQYCQRNYKDFFFHYTRSDGDKMFIELSDENFPLREWKLRSTNNSKDKKNLEMLRQQIFATNTAGSDILDLAEVMSADTISALIEVGRRNRLEAEQKEQAQREHEQSLVDKQIESQATLAKEQADWEEASKERDRENRLEVARLSALGRAADKDSNELSFSEINKAAQNAVDNEFKEKTLLNNQRQVDIKQKQTETQTAQNLMKINLELEKLKLKKQEIEAKKYIATINKN